MAFFQSHVGKKVAVQGGYFEFKSEVVEVADKDLIERLSKAKGVESVKAPPKQKDDKKDDKSDDKKDDK